jgi:XTP/dITP diphosphohydrolase/tetrapyrrole methylase family protein/MazG family protein
MRQQVRLRKCKLVGVVIKPFDKHASLRLPYRRMPTAIESLVATVARLRAPDGCPWDRDQTHKTLCDCLIEEVAELLETIDRADYPHMREELGDLLLQVVMHAQMAAERGDFDFEDVAREVNEKMIRRHPHVFGDSKAGDTAAVLKQWDEIKAIEKAAKAPAAVAVAADSGVPDSQAAPPAPLSGTALFKETPPALSALLKAREVWKTVKKKKLAIAPVAADPSEIAARAAGLTEEQAGAELFAWTAACREAGIDPESALRRHTARVMDSATAG